VKNCLQISKNITRKADSEQLSYETFSTIRVYFRANPGRRAGSSRSEVTWVLGLGVRIPLSAWMFVFCVFCVLCR